MNPSSLLKLRRTGKVFLLGALVCAGQMYGMEPLYPPQKSSKAGGQDYMAMLPKEIKQYIILMLVQSSTMEEAIHAIRSLTETNKVFNEAVNDLIIIRAIIRILAQKFNEPSEYIAQKLNTKGSQQYINLSLQLMTALWEKNFTQAEQLVHDGADIDFQTADTPLTCGPIDKIQSMPYKGLTAVYNLSDPDVWPATPNTICVIGGRFSLVMYAIASNQTTILEWLIKHKANLNLTMGTGDTALLIAISLGNKKIIELLIKNGADVNQENALEVPRKIYNQFIVFEGVNKLVGPYNGTLYSLLDTDLLSPIFGNGFYRSGVTPLLGLLWSEQFTKEELFDLFSLLLNHGANPNVKDVDAPLILVTMMQDEGVAKLMKLLLDHGADPSIKDSRGQIALDIMHEESSENDPERDEKIQLLEKAMKKEKK